ncbi:hypothetical protein [Spirosoma aerolatum]|uniref:hypothetical protein n=1 Tax=Spirosoma aerolatum TaxID=1211326 RepID=UPI0009AD3878|nr:hypothetical protein [Spirosoma aerolatum]
MPAQLTPRTKEQNSKFHTLLTLRHFDKEDKLALVQFYTGGRETSSSNMSMDEMAEAIKHLEGEQDASIRRMRAKIINVARDIFNLWPQDNWTQEHYDKLNVFLKKKFKAELSKLSYEQLRNAVTAVEKWRDSGTQKFLKDLLNNT